MDLISRRFGLQMIAAILVFSVNFSYSNADTLPHDEYRSVGNLSTEDQISFILTWMEHLEALVTVRPANDGEDRVIALAVGDVEYQFQLRNYDDGQVRCLIARFGSSDSDYLRGWLAADDGCDGSVDLLGHMAESDVEEVELTPNTQAHFELSINHFALQLNMWVAFATPDNLTILKEDVDRYVEDEGGWTSFFNNVILPKISDGDSIEPFSAQLAWIHQEFSRNLNIEYDSEDGFVLEFIEPGTHLQFRGGRPAFFMSARSFTDLGEGGVWTPWSATSTNQRKLAEFIFYIGALMIEENVEFEQSILDAISAS